MNNKFIFLIIGASGTGKTTLANDLEKYRGLKQVESYTTRPPRFKNEKGHTFVSKQEFNKLTDMVAYTEYNNYQYCATQAQIDDCDLYIIDPYGAFEFFGKYKGDKGICVLFLSANKKERAKRMGNRGDGLLNITERLGSDSPNFSKDKIEKLKSMYPHFYEIDANTDTLTVYLKATEIIDKVSKEK